MKTSEIDYLEGVSGNQLFAWNRMLAVKKAKAGAALIISLDILKYKI